MKIEEELKMKAFEDELLKAHINVLFTASWLYNRISAVIKQYHISQEQYNVLRILRGQSPKAICQKDILSRMIDRSSNLTKIVRKLTDKQYIDVQKSEVDRREYLISITESGLSLLQRIDLVLNPEMQRISAISVSEAFHLNHLLDKMREVEE